MPNANWNNHDMDDLYGTNNCSEAVCWPAHQLNREVEIGKARREAVAKWRSDPAEPLEPYYNSTVPCYRGGHKCRWPACEADCDGRPGKERKLTPDEDALVRYGKAWESALSVLFGGGR